jgi:hypothetical protein
MPDTENLRPQDRVLRELPPRHLDVYTQATILFGGFLQQFGWIFFGFGMIFVWVFAWNSQVRHWLSNLGQWEETEGIIVMAETTNASQNEVPVVQYTFQYEVNGRRHLGRSYTSGQTFSESENVPVMYKPRQPSRAYIKGSRQAMFGWWAVLVVLFPLIGAVFVAVSIKSNLKFLHLLRIGEFTRGALASRKATGGEVVINSVHYPVYDYRFAFEYAGKAYEATCKTHLGELVEDGAQEIILFDRFRPEYNIVYDVVPNAPRITPDGRMASSGWRSAWVLLLPIVSLAGHGWWAWYLMH